MYLDYVVDIPLSLIHIFYDNYELDFMLVDRNDRKYGIEVKSNNKLSENKIQRGMKKEMKF